MKAGHYARVLVEVDLKKPIRDHILVEMEDFAFHVYVDYEYLPSFCTSCSTIGHSAEACFKSQQNKDQVRRDSGNLVAKKYVLVYVPKDKAKDHAVVQSNKRKEVLIDESPKDLAGTSGHGTGGTGKDLVPVPRCLSDKVLHVIEEVHVDQLVVDKQGSVNTDLVDDSASVDTIFDESVQVLPNHVSDKVVQDHIPENAISHSQEDSSPRQLTGSPKGIGNSKSGKLTDSLSPQGQGNSGNIVQKDLHIIGKFWESVSN